MNSRICYPFHYPLIEKFCSYSSHNKGKEIDSDLLKHLINQETEFTPENFLNDMKDPFVLLTAA